jgi:hypothetical protein
MLRESRNKTIVSCSHLTDKIERLVNQSKRLRSRIRSAANQAGSSYPIEIIDGNSPPQLVGHGFYWRWKGKWKTAPGSYQSSTHRIKVGYRWVLSNVS